MTRGMFGWSLPPGVSVRDLPGNQDVPCEVCGQYDDACVCPECPNPGCYHIIGDMRCYRAGHLELSDQQNAARQEAKEQDARDREAEEAYWKDVMNPEGEDIV